MNRRAFMSGLPLGFCSLSFSSKAAAGVTASDIDLMIEQRFEDNTVDYGTVLTAQNLTRIPDASKSELVNVLRDPKNRQILEDGRKKGLLRLKLANLDHAIKLELLNLQLEKIFHSVATCLDHFLGVHDILKAWGHSDDVALMGLFHAIYGTEFNDVQVLNHADPNDTKRLENLIGPKAAQLTFLYGVMDSMDCIHQVKKTGKPPAKIRMGKKVDPTQPKLEIDADLFKALVDGQVANALEPYLATNADPKYIQTPLKTYLPLRPYLSDSAKAALVLHSVT